MNTLAPQTGLLIMLSYALFNLYNILLLRISFPFITIWLLSAGIVYLIFRFNRFMQGQQGFARSEVMVFILIALSFVAISLQYLNLQEYAGADGVYMLKNLRTEWVLSMLWLFAGGAVAVFSIKESPTWAIIVLALTVIAFINGLDEQLMVSYSEINSVGVIEGINHLYLEKHVVFLIILAYSFSPKTKWIVAVAGMFLLFSMGGRSSLFVFAICLVGMNVGKQNFKSLLYLGIVGLLVLFSLRYAVDNQFIDTDDHRVMKMLFLDGVGEDNSFQARVQLFELGLQNLDEQFLFGDPTIISQIAGEQGGYIHNILSMWQFYGFFVFACAVVILIFCLKRMIVLKSTSPTPKIIFGSFFLMYVSISVIVAKGSHWDLLWFMIGFWTLLPATSLKRKYASNETAEYNAYSNYNVNYNANYNANYNSNANVNANVNANAKTKQEPTDEQLQAAAASYRRLGDSAFQNNTNEALEAYEKAVTLWPNDIEAWNQLGHLYSRIGELDDAIDANERVGNLAASSDDQPMWSAVSLGNLGTVYRIKGDLDRAIKLYEKSLEINQAIDHMEGMANVYSNLGNAYRAKGYLDRSIELHEQALAIHNELGEQQGIAGDYGNLGVVYKSKGELNQAIELFKQSLKIFKLIDNKEGMAIQYSNLGNFYKTIGDLDQARDYLEKSIDNYDAIGSPNADMVDSWLAELPTNTEF